MPGTDEAGGGGTRASGKPTRRRRRGHGEGSITRRSDGRWEARMSVPGGKRKSFYGKTRADVQRALTAALRDRDRGIPAVRDDPPLGSYLESWLATVKPRVRPTTFVRWREYVRRHTIPTLGGVRLSKLTPQHLQQLYAAKLAGGLSPTTVRHLHGRIRTALGAAERLGLAARNVALLVDPPRARRREMHVWTAEEARAFLQATEARDDRLRALYVVALSTGMRLGELLALRWRAVDLDRKHLAVVATLTPAPDGQRGYLFSDPKTPRSRRQIRLSATAREALRAHRARQAAERLAAGTLWRDLDLVFCTKLGGPLSASNLRRDSFAPALELAGDAAGVPRIRLHDLRHTAATLLLSRRVNPKIVSETLGHSSVAITLDIYSHVLPDMQRDAAAAMDDALAPASDGASAHAADG